MADDVLLLLGLDGASSPSPATPPISMKNKCKDKRKSSKKRCRNESNSDVHHKQPPVKKRKTSASPSGSEHRKIGRKRQNITITTGISLSEIDRIDAELEKAFQEKQATPYKDTVFIKKITSEDNVRDDYGDELTIKNLGSYLAEHKADDVPNTNNSCGSNKCHNLKRYNTDDMAEINVMLAPYEKEANELQKLKTLNEKLNKETALRQSNEKKKVKSKKNRKKCVKKVRQKSRDKKRMNNNDKTDKRNVDSLDLKLNEDKKRMKLKDEIRKTPKKSSKQTRKRIEFQDLLRNKANCAKKRKTQRIVEAKDNELRCGKFDEQAMDHDGLELIYDVPETQIETQHVDDVEHGDSSDNSVNFDAFDLF